MKASEGLEKTKEINHADEFYGHIKETVNKKIEDTYKSGYFECRIEALDFSQIAFYANSRTGELLNNPFGLTERTEEFSVLVSLGYFFKNHSEKSNFDYYLDRLIADLRKDGFFVTSKRLVNPGISSDRVLDISWADIPRPELRQIQ